MKKNNIPDLRFPQFNEPWTVKTLGEIGEILCGFAFKGSDILENEGNYKLMRGVNISEGFIRHSEEIDRYYSNSIDKLEKYRLKSSDLVISMDGSKVGRNSALLTDDDEGSLLVQRVCRIRNKKQSNIIFLYLNINNSRFHLYVDKVKTSSAIPHISASDITEYPISLPSLPEQQKIADFLSGVDEKIGQLERRLALEEQYKKGMMQRLFDQEIRFKDENGNEFPDWEEKKLGEVCEIKRGGSPRPINKYITDDPDGLNWIKIGDVSSDTNVIYSCKEKIIKEGLSKTRQVFKGDLILSNSMSFGRPYILNIDGCIHDGWLLIRDNNKFFDRYFLCYSLSADYIQQQYKSLAAGGVVINLNSELVQSTTISLPTLPEQQKIADFLSSLDEKIGQTKAELEKARDWKRGLMQRMFV